MRLIPAPGDDWDAREVVLLELAECQLFVDRLRRLVDAYDRLLTDALTYMPPERDRMPPIVPVDYLE